MGHFQSIDSRGFPRFTLGGHSLRVTRTRRRALDFLGNVPCDTDLNRGGGGGGSMEVLGALSGPRSCNGVC